MIRSNFEKAWIVEKCELDERGQPNRRLPGDSAVLDSCLKSQRSSTLRVVSIDIGNSS